MREGVEKRLWHLEKRHDKEQFVKRKRSEDYGTLEEVFDKPTLMTIYGMLNTGALKGLYGILNTGKEARVYLGELPDGGEVAVKIYLTTSSEFKKGMLIYIEGDPRFTRVRKDTRSLVYTWAMKEYRNLLAAFYAGVRVPKPMKVEKNVLLMEFIGKDGSPAPLLRETHGEDMHQIYKTLMRYVRAMYRKAHLVHGDLSEYNVMIYKGKPVVFDLSQAVLTAHPRAKEYLQRDLSNLERYFGNLGVEVKPLDEAYKWVTGGREE